MGGDSFLGVGESPGGGTMDTFTALRHVAEEEEHGFNDYDHDVPIHLDQDNDETNQGMKDQLEEEKGEEEVELEVAAELGVGFGPIFRPGSGLELDDGDDGAGDGEDGDGAAMESFAVEEGQDYDDGQAGNDDGSLMTKNEIWFKTALLPRSTAQKQQTKTDSLLQFLARPSSAHHFQHHHEHPFVEDQRGYAVVAQEQQELLQIQEEWLQQQQQQQQQQHFERAKRAQSAGSAESSRTKERSMSRLKSAPSKRGPQVAVESGTGIGLESGIGLDAGQWLESEPETETGTGIIDSGPVLESETGLGSEPAHVNNVWFASLESEIVPVYTPTPPTDT